MRPSQAVLGHLAQSPVMGQPDARPPLPGGPRAGKPSDGLYLSRPGGPVGAQRRSPPAPPNVKKVVKKALTTV